MLICRQQQLRCCCHLRRITAVRWTQRRKILSNSSALWHGKTCHAPCTVTQEDSVPSLPWLLICLPCCPAPGAFQLQQVQVDLPCLPCWRLLGLSSGETKLVGRYQVVSVLCPQEKNLSHCFPSFQKGHFWLAPIKLRRYRNPYYWRIVYLSVYRLALINFHVFCFTCIIKQLLKGYQDISEEDL